MAPMGMNANRDLELGHYQNEKSSIDHEAKATKRRILLFVFVVCVCMLVGAICWAGNAEAASSQKGKVWNWFGRLCGNSHQHSQRKQQQPQQQRSEQQPEAVAQHAGSPSPDYGYWLAAGWTQRYAWEKCDSEMVSALEKLQENGVVARFHRKRGRGAWKLVKVDSSTTYQLNWETGKVRKIKFGPEPCTIVAEEEDVFSVKPWIDDGTLLDRICKDLRITSLDDVNVQVAAETGTVPVWEWYKALEGRWTPYDEKLCSQLERAWNVCKNMQHEQNLIKENRQFEFDTGSENPHWTRLRIQFDMDVNHEQMIKQEAAFGIQMRWRKGAWTPVDGRQFRRQRHDAVIRPWYVEVDYERGTFVGRGVNAEVFRAQQGRTKRLFAMKNVPNTPEGREEIRIQQSLRNSPHVVQLFDAFPSPQEKGKLTVRMSLGGQCLMDLWRNSDLRWNSNKAVVQAGMANILAKVVAGVEDLQRAGVVHFDLHGGNLLCVHRDPSKDAAGMKIELEKLDFQVKIIDFGMSTKFDLSKGIVNETDDLGPNFTVRTLGESLRRAEKEGRNYPHYAPELKTSAKYFAAAPIDIYSCGNLLGWMMADLGNKEVRASLEAETGPNSCADLRNKMKDPNPKKRWTIEKIREHPWYKKFCENITI